MEPLWTTDASDLAHGPPTDGIKSLNIAPLAYDELSIDESLGTESDEADDVQRLFSDSPHVYKGTVVGLKYKTFMQYTERKTRGLLVHCLASGLIAFVRNPFFFYAATVLNIEPEFLSAMGAIFQLPFAFRVCYGLISDVFPILKYRRRPYIALGWVIFSLAYLPLYRIESLDIGIAVFCIFVGTCGFVMADVAASAIVIEWSREEEESIRGKLVLYTYVVRFVGLFLGCVFGTCLYDGGANNSSWKLTINQVCLVQSLMPCFVVLPFVYHMSETPVLHAYQNVRHVLWTNVCDVYDTVCNTAVHIPLLYILLQHVCLVGNPAWYKFLTIGLGFTVVKTGLLGVICTASISGGLLIYSTFFEKSNWRSVFVYTTIMRVVVTPLQILLILRLNLWLHIPDMVIAAGDDVLLELIYAFYCVPTFRLMILMCPEGSEGLAFTMLASASMLGYSVATCISTSLTQIWDVSSSALKAQDFHGVLYLTILVNAIVLLPLPLVQLLPTNQTEQLSAMKMKKRNKLGGKLLFVWTLGATFFVTFTVIRVYNHRAADILF